MKRFIHTDEQGLKWIVKAPSEAEAGMGIVVGPPDISGTVPEQYERSLHAELFNRGLITRDDVRARPQEIVAALQSALKIDATKIINLYQGKKDLRR